MKDGFIRVACVGIQTAVADCQTNADNIINAIKQCVGKGTKLAVFPELCVTGYSCGDLFLQNSLLSSAESALQKITRATKDSDMLIAVGAPLKVNSKLFNCAVVINNGEIIGVVPKTFLPDYTEYYESRHFVSARDNLETTIKIYDKEIPFGTDIIFESRTIKDFKAAFEICEDLWVAASPSVSHALQGATVIGNLSASNETVGKNTYRKDLVRIHSAKLSCAYLYASCGFGESTTDLVFCGAKLICENGNILGEKNDVAFSDNQQSILLSEVDLQVLSYERQRMNTFFNNAGELKQYRKVYFNTEPLECILTREYHQTPFIPSETNEKNSRLKDIIQMQSAALATRSMRVNPKKLVIGISGGLDSTLALLICAQSLKMLNRPASDIIAITMPGPGTTKQTLGNAKRLIFAVGATYRIIPIGDEVLRHLNAIGHKGEHDTTYENAQARERTKILMNTANMEGGIVVGTCDLSEVALGFSTYNGDHMSMYNVNSGVPKTLVRHLINYISQQSEEELCEVLKNVISTPISPELLPPDENGAIVQKTEDILGDYIIHDFILYYMLRFGFSPEKLLRLLKNAFKNDYTEDILKKTLDTFLRRFYTSQFKRSCMPAGPKIGSVSLSPRGDWRMPDDLPLY